MQGYTESESHPICGVFFKAVLALMLILMLIAFRLEYNHNEEKASQQKAIMQGPDIVHGVKGGD